jgi:anti-anti-sigma factor
MNIRTEAATVDGFPLLKVYGNLEFSTAGRLMMFADDAWDPETKLLILDLQGVDHIDSAGVGELVTIKKRARQKDGNVVFTHVSEVAHYVLEMAGMKEPLEVYETPEEAIAAQAALGATG